MKGVSHKVNAKGRGRVFPRSHKEASQEVEVKNETSLVIRNVGNVSASNAIGDDKENNNVNPKEEQDIPKDPNAITEQISVHVNCKQTEKTNEKEIVVIVIFFVGEC